MFSAASRSARPLSCRSATAAAARNLEHSALPRRAASSSLPSSSAARAAPTTRTEVVSAVPKAIKLIGAGAVVAAFGLGLSIGKTAGAEGAGAKSSTSSIRPSSPYALRLKAAAEAYPPAFGSTDDFLAGIDELRALFGRQGRADDVSVDDSDLESHGISACLITSTTLWRRPLCNATHHSSTVRSMELPL